MKISLNNFIVSYVLILVYVIPLNMSINGENISIYSYTRLGVVFLYVITLVLTKDINILALIPFLLFCIKYIMLGEITYEYIYIACSIGLVTYSNLQKEYLHNVKTIKIITFFYMIQILICTYLNDGTIISTCNDRNYTGFFVFLLFVLNYYYRLKTWIIVAIVGGLTFSRLYILAIFSFFLIQLIQKTNKGFKIKDIKVYSFFYLIIQLLIVPISYIYQYFFKKGNYVYQYLTGIKRFSKILDGSNNIRTLANIYAIDSLSIRNIIFGLEDNTFIGLTMFGNKRIYPHNTMLVMYVKFGGIVSAIYIYVIYAILKRIYYNIGFVCSILLYQMFLGPSTYYGIEVILINVVVNMIKDECRRNL